MKKYLVPVTALFLSIGLVGCDANNPEQQKAKEEAKQQKEQEKLEKKQQKEEEKERKQQEKEQEKQQKEQEKLEKQKQKEEEKEHKKQEEAQKKQEKEEQKKNNDKVVYENEIKPKVDSIVKEYDSIWAEHWRPTFDAMSKNPNAMNPKEIEAKMKLISEKYDHLSSEIVKLKLDDKLNDPVNKKSFSNFKNEFVLATSYRSNAAQAVTQGIKGVAPMNDRMQESIKSIELSDAKLITALANTVEIEQRLGILKK
ncbi:ribonuclease [Bacillus cereus group sp. MYBK35-2]|uniref:ribonuclease n=1 Tax=unclassified Bacillus cereus group TaxID=2750818 RepID=UPI0029F1585D|nr:ribonuclease [Bacillus cereus]MDA2314671.1 ribonuclease [Bacillus cereus]MDA2499337.1 ribonuclease [Bacillus cereus]